MNTKFVIFVAIGSLFVAAIYSSSLSVVYGTIACAKSKDGKTAFCTDSVKETFYKCSKGNNGKWSCQDITPREAGSTNIPPALNDAIGKAKASITAGGNESTSAGLKDKISKGENFLKGGETLKDDQNSQPNNTSNGNATIQ